MARKGREPLSEAPPAAGSSSSDEESGDDSTGEEEEEQLQTHLSSTEEEEEEEETLSSQPPEKPSSVKKAPTQKKPEPRKPAGDSDTEPDSDSDSDLPPPLKVKPIASKPMEESSKAKKLAGSKPSSVAGKRTAPENEKSPSKKTKTADKPESSAVTQDEGKKLLFQRLWSEEDELVILKGMIDYKVKKEKDPMGDPDDFLVFIKKSLKFVDANKGQIVNKVQRLKKKYENNANKKRKITNPNELKAFELSKQVWGGDGVRVDDNGVGENNHNSSLNNASNNAKGRASTNSKSKANKGSVNGQALDDGKKVESRKSKGGDEGEISNWVLSRCEREMPMSLIGGGSSLGFFNERVLNEGMKLLGEREKAEMGEKLRKHNVAEMEVYLKRLELVREVAQKTLNALKSARS